MESMELQDIVLKEKEDTNNAHVAKQKCEYDRNMDAHVAFLAYLLKPLQDTIKELYVDSTLNITNHPIFFVVLVKWCRLIYPLCFAMPPLWYMLFHFHCCNFFCIDILKLVRSLFLQGSSFHCNTP
jgi:hypothetical protein